MSVLIDEAFAIMGGAAPSPDLEFVDGGMARVPGAAHGQPQAQSPQRSGPDRAARLAWMANWVRASTRTPTRFNPMEQELLSNLLFLSCFQLEISPQLGWKIAQLLDLLAGETAAQSTRMPS